MKKNGSQNNSYVTRVIAFSRQPPLKVSCLDTTCWILSKLNLMFLLLMTGLRKRRNSAGCIFTDHERNNRYLNMNPHGLFDLMSPIYCIWSLLPLYLSFLLCLIDYKKFLHAKRWAGHTNLPVLVFMNLSHNCNLRFLQYQSNVYISVCNITSCIKFEY